MGQYFENDKNVKSDKKLIKFNFDGECISVYSDNGVFSKGRLDYGTRLLLSNIDIKNLSGRVLDLGCGIGVVGVILGIINKNVSIDMVDINERAILLSKENILLNGLSANVFVSDGYEKVSGKYDYIVTNPPIRAGKDVVLNFLMGSADYLFESGILYFVMRKDHGVKSMIKELESKFDIQILEKEKGFYVVKCQIKS